MTDPALLPDDPERRLSLAYAPAHVRAALGLIWKLDEQLGAIVARAEQPAVAQMRLAWWHDTLTGLRTVRPVDPLLAGIADTASIDADALLPLIDGWEVLLDPLPLSEQALDAYATMRGATLFAAAAKLLGSVAGAGSAGRLWALTDLAFRVSDRTTAERALGIAPALPTALPASLRILATLADRDRKRGLDRPRRQGSPLRVARAMLAGLTGL